MTNIAVSEGTGKTVATETISTVEYGLIKLVDATATSTTRTGVAANPLQVSLANTGTNATPVVISGSISAAGDVAHDAADSGNPVKMGGKAVSSEPSAVTAADRANFITDLVGKHIVLPYANPENFVMGTTAAITDTTSTSVIASAGGSLRNYVTQITVSNSHATVGTFVKILDGSTIIWECYAAAGGGGATATFPVPLKGTAATAINCQPVTTGSNVIASVSGYKGL